MIRLERSVTVHTFDVEATVAVRCDHPGVLAVARLTADLGRPIDGRDVTRELLGGLPELVGWRVIELCVALGLLKREARGAATLSAAGAAALEQGAVLIPQERPWRFYLIDDPLVDDKLVHVARIETPSAKDERNELNAAKRDGRPRPGPGQPVPEVIGRAAGAGHVWSSVATGAPFEVRDVAERGLAGPPGSLRLLLEWDLEWDRYPQPARVTLRGELDRALEDPHPQWHVDHVIPARALDETSYRGLWMALVEASTGLEDGELWSLYERLRDFVVPVSFDERLDSAARRSLRQDLYIPEVEFVRLGRFEPSTLKGIHLVPRTHVDAQRWAEWMQWDLVSDYVTPDMLQEISRKVESRFSSQLPFPAPKLPGPEELLRRAQESSGKDAKARFLLAPADLGLWS